MRVTNRFAAFGIHLGISLAIFVALLLIIVLYWYPGVFIEAGGWHGIKIAAGVDLVLGPLLTLIVFNPKKKKLKMDLALIAAFQFSCLAAGIWIIDDERPMIQVFTEDSLYVHTKSDLRALGIPVDTIENLPGSFPKKAYVELPLTLEETATMAVTSVITKGKELDARDDLFRPLTVADKPKYEWRLSKLEYDDKKQCYWLPMLSAHYTGQGCLNLAEGAVAVRLYNTKE